MASQRHSLGTRWRFYKTPAKLHQPPSLEADAQKIITPVLLMLFPTYQFLVFFLIIFLLAIFLKRKVTWYKWLLLLGSLFFYSFWSLYFLFLLMVNTVFNYFIILLLFKHHINKKQVLIGGLAFNLFYLGLFKYYNFFAASLLDLLNYLKINSSLEFIQILAPVGVSFYTFRVISHLVDCYNNKISCPSILNYAVYVTYFPQIASGPISRAKEFYAQLNTANKYDYQIEEVIILILSGLFKKYTLSSFLFNFTQLPFRLPQQYSSLDLILAAISYSCLIYVDFSGYSDLSNGISSLLGFKPIENFNMPYQSLSLREFWKRWHISLSECLRDYLYIPFGGNQYGKFKKYINLFLTMLIGGLWHGAGLNFIIWGAIHGLGLVVNHMWIDLTKMIQFKQKASLYILEKLLCCIITFTFVTFSWIFFNTKTLETAIKFIDEIIHSEINTVQFNYWQLYLVIIMVSLMNFYGNNFRDGFIKILSVNNFIFKFALVYWLSYIIIMLGPNTVPPFIYFKF